MNEAPSLYYNRMTGEAVAATTSQARALGAYWEKAERVITDKGEPAFRFRVGHATVDISEVKGKIPHDLKTSK